MLPNHYQHYYIIWLIIMLLAYFWVISIYHALIGIVILQRLMISCIIVYLTVSLYLGLTQFVLEPTRINFNGVSNILDIILCNDPLTININSVTEPIGTSDHSIVNFSVFVPPSDNSHATLSDNVIHNSNQLLPSITMLPVFNWSAGDFWCYKSRVEFNWLASLVWFPFHCWCFVESI